MDLVIEDDSRIETVYFLMSEDNIPNADRASMGSVSALTPIPKALMASFSSPARIRAPSAILRAFTLVMFARKN